MAGFQLTLHGRIWVIPEARNVSALRTKLEEMTCSGEWIVSDIRKRVREYGDIPPFGLYFKPESTVDVITGEVVVVSAFSMQELTEQLEGKKITLSWQRRSSDLFPMDFKPKYPLDGEFEIQTKNICQWHWLRVLYSFLSLETFVERCAEVLSPEELARFAGLLRRMTINGGLQHCIGKEVSRFGQGKDDFIENIDDMCIHYDGGRVAANESLVEEISTRGLRKTTKQTGLDRKTIRAILKGKKVKAATLAKVVMGVREE